MCYCSRQLTLYAWCAPHRTYASSYNWYEASDIVWVSRGSVHVLRLIEHGGDVPYLSLKVREPWTLGSPVYLVYLFCGSGGWAMFRDSVKSTRRRPCNSNCCCARRLCIGYISTCYVQVQGISLPHRYSVQTLRPYNMIHLSCISRHTAQGPSRGNAAETA